MAAQTIAAPLEPHRERILPHWLQELGASSGSLAKGRVTAEELRSRHRRRASADPVI